MSIRLPLLFAVSLSYFFFRLWQYGLSIDSDEWGILNASREILRGNLLAGDPNKTLELLLGIVPVYFDEPLLFPVLTSLIGAGACLAVYLLVLHLTGDRVAALLAWGMLLLSPVLYWQVIVCNSVAIMTALVLIAIYYFSQGKIQSGCVWMALAELSRPEPFFVLPFLLLYFAWLCRKGEISRWALTRGVTILGLPIVWWLAFSFMRSGSGLAGVVKAVDYGKAVGSGQGLLVFPRVFWRILEGFYMGPAAALVALAGVVGLMLAFRRYAYLYGYLLFTLLGQWVLVTFGTAMQERFLLPIHAVLLVFTAALFAALRKNLNLGLKQGGFQGAVSPLIACGLLIMSPSLNGYRTVDQIVTYHNGFSADLPQPALLLRKAIAENPEPPPVILISARRMARMDYLLDDLRHRYALVSFRDLYFHEQKLNDPPIAWVVYAQEDLYPMKSAFYNMNLMSDEGLRRQGLRLSEIRVLSERTRLLKLAR